MELKGIHRDRLAGYVFLAFTFFVLTPSSHALEAEICGPVSGGETQIPQK